MGNTRIQEPMRVKPGYDEVLPDELSDGELRECISEAVRRGTAVSRHMVEQAYEALLKDDQALCRRLLSGALFPHGGDHLPCVVAARRRAA